MATARGNSMKKRKDAAEVRGGVRGGETLGSRCLWSTNRDKGWTHDDPVGRSPRAEQRRLRSHRGRRLGRIVPAERSPRRPGARFRARDHRPRGGRRPRRLLLAELGARSRGVAGSARSAPAGPSHLGRPAGGTVLPLARNRRALRRRWPPVDQAQEEGDTLGGAGTARPQRAGGRPTAVGREDRRQPSPAVCGPRVGVELGAECGGGGFGSAAHDPIARRRPGHGDKQAAASKRVPGRGEWSPPPTRAIATLRRDAQRPSGHAGGADLAVRRSDGTALPAAESSPRPWSPGHGRRRPRSSAATPWPSSGPWKHARPRGAGRNRNRRRRPRAERRHHSLKAV